MSQGRGAQYVVLLALIGIPLAVPGLQTTAFGGWPALGVAVALLLLAGERHRWVALAAMTVVISAALTHSYEVPLWQGLLGSLSVTGPALLSSWLLGVTDHGQLRLPEVSIVRYHVATGLGALLCALMSAVTVITLMSPRDVGLTALMAFLAGLTAQLVVLPLLMRARGDRRGDASQLELSLERLLLALVLAIVFWPHAGLGVAFMALPLLAWAALRASRREAHLQLFVVGVVAYTLTFLGHGSLVDAPRDGMPGPLAPALLYLYLAAAAVLTVPLALTVERLVAVTGQATRAATTLERMLSASTGSLFIATDAGGRITHYNSGAEQTLGWTPEEVLGRSPEMFHTPEEVARAAASFGVPPVHSQVVLAQVASGARRDWEFRCKDGSTRITALSLSEINDPSGKVLGYIGTGEDITERMRAQEALITALDREHSSVLRLQEVDHVKQELVSNVSHELRTPITSIAGYAELLADGDLGELNRLQVDAVRRIERNTSRLGLLVEDLLTLSRAESNQLEFVTEELDLRRVAGEAHYLLEEVIRTRHLDVRVVVPDAPVSVNGDGSALERVALNLLSNAVKFTPDGGSVTVTVEPSGKDATMTVSDTGMGITEEDQQHLFTRFFRASAATENAIQGTGLGLSIVHAIVTRHGGDVTVESAPGRGTSVRVLLPLA
jgi:PAS domain S-box-containing protein